MVTMTMRPGAKRKILKTVFGMKNTTAENYMASHKTIDLKIIMKLIS